ncbi:RNA polymerase sigma-70 factor [Pseudoflavitalea rhizosphaerae]|uniref:RNA polymerase sigma-70 factor n=1 Tax=Pseudoflavitalea rhizosphaerae TaxID=1884793 RepID=UPI000F8E4099|nr:RNA polymerase sigma-70 factor [Pseudoflavitalea rhizosphaerae]
MAKAVETYFRTHMNGLHRYAWSILRNNEAAKDAVQAVFLRLWEKRQEIDEQQSVQSWLYTSVYHFCLNAKRHELVRKDYQLQQLSIYQQPGFRDNLIGKERLQQITDALESLPPQCRIIFYKSRFDKMKYAAIAEELGISVKTVEAQIGKALRILRKKLSGVLVMIILYVTT